MTQKLLGFLLAASLAGCGRGNGLPADLISHLAREGIAITPQRAHAPLSSRGGYVVVDGSPSVTTNIVAKLKLQQVTPEDRQWSFVLQRVGDLPGIKEMWGIAGRPTQLRLKNGGQFEFFYVVVTLDGRIYLVAEYAYG